MAEIKELKEDHLNGYEKTKSNKSKEKRKVSIDFGVLDIWPFLEKEFIQVSII